MQFNKDSKEQVIAHLSKSIVKIEGIDVSSLKPHELEEKISNELDSVVRVIGVTSGHVEMDVYNLSPEQIYKNEEGILKAVSLCEGINAKEVMQMSRAEKAHSISMEELQKLMREGNSCDKEKLLIRETNI